MVMMAPTIVVAAASPPTVMMATTAVSHMAVTITSPDLDDSSLGTAKSARCRGGYCRRRQVWNYCKSAGGKSDQQKPFHFVFPLLNSRCRDKEESFGSSQSSIRMPADIAN